jgi:lipopolysaccharide biosynthesis glycosyltransferase
VKHVCLCSDPNYVVPLAVALRSVVESQASVEALQITIGSFGLSSEDQARVRSSVSPLAVEFVSLAERVPLDIPPSAHVNRAAYGRTKVFDVLPREARRAIFLDTDLIVCDNLDYLFSFDLGGAPIAAVQSAIVSQSLPQWRDLGLAPTTPYLQTGVFVADLEAWRARALGDAVLQFTFEHADTLRWADQDGFNALLAGNFARLPLRWNAESVLRRATHSAYTLFEADEVEEAILNPAVVHFSGMHKPWHPGSTDPATNEWTRLLANTEYRDYEPERSAARSVASGPLLGLRRRALALARKTLRL